MAVGSISRKSQMAPAWKVNDAWRQVRRRSVERFLGDGTMLFNSLSKAQNDMSTGMATLATEASIKRIKSEISNSRASVNRLV